MRVDISFSEVKTASLILWLLVTNFSPGLVQYRTTLFLLIVKNIAYTYIMENLKTYSI